MADTYSMTKTSGRPMDMGKAKPRRSYDMHAGSPSAYNTSGLEHAMHEHAEQLHPVKKKKRTKKRY